MKETNDSLENRSGDQGKYARARERMVRQQIAARGIREQRVLEAMRAVPRHLFVPVDAREMAYQDGPLRIGQGQTISQPYIVALMTEMLELTGHERVLEIGTGSGYQAAILSLLASHVYTIERHAALASRARELLHGLGYQNISIRVGDGTLGWPEHAPYDAVMITAAAPSLPDPLIDQLADGGRLVAPVGGGWSQMLVRIRREGKKLHSEEMSSVAFVPLIGEFGWADES